MERCPNCGSSVRTGAKFCTTCGFRLPLPASPEAPASGRRSPFDTTSSDTVLSRWSDPARPAPAEPDAVVKQAIAPHPAPAAAAPEPPAPDASPAAPGEPAGSAPGAGQGAPPFSGWGGYGTGFGPRASAWGADPKADEAPLPVYQDLPPAPPESKHTVEDAVAAWSAGRDLAVDEDATVEADAAPQAMAPDGAALEAMPAGGEELTPRPSSASGQWAWPPDDVAEEAGEQPAVATAPDDIAQPEPAPEEAPVAADVVPGEAVEEPAADAVPDEPVEELAAVLTDGAADADGVDDASPPEPAGTDDVAPMPVPATAVEEPDPAARVATLVAELQELVPRLTTKSTAAGADLDAVIGTLDESLTGSADEQETFAQLRAAVATAQARPRDVDVMLDLVARADAMAAVFDAHDRYRSAIQRAVKGLRGERDEEPAPRW